MNRLKITSLRMVINFHNCCRLQLKVNGKRTSGVVLYDREVIIIHYGGTKQLCLKDYNNFDGDLAEFLAQNLADAPIFTGFKDSNMDPTKLDFLGG